MENKEQMEYSAKALGRDLPISTKQSIEICNLIRGKEIKKVKTLLNQCLDMKKAIPFKRFTNGVGHKKGKIAAGRFPQKATKHILKIIDSALSNARDKGLNEEQLIIKSAKANYASRPLHFGRKRRIKMKRTHIEILVEELEELKKSSEKIKEVKHEVKKEEAKKEQVQEKTKTKVVEKK